MSQDRNHLAVSAVQRQSISVPWAFIVRSTGMMLLAVLPALIFAYLAHRSSDWHLFERSGSIVTIIGLLLASRRYFALTVTDLMVARTKNDIDITPREALNLILDTRRGFTLSAFGTLIWGWGIYLRWWSFAALVLWLAFVIFRAFFDPVLQNGGDGAPWVGQ